MSTDTNSLTRLVDSRLGLVTAIEEPARHPSLPDALSIASARLAGLPPGAATPGGAAWWSRTTARTAALGEAVERYAATHRVIIRRASADELTAEGVAHLDPVALAPHSAGQYAAPGFPFTAPDRGRTISWCRAVDVQGAEVLVPASRVGLEIIGGEPIPHLPINAGIAAGSDLARAGAAALEEALERHAVATSWIGGLSWPRLPVPDWLLAVLGGRAACYDIAVHAVPDPFGLPVTAVLLTQKDGPVLGMGTALRPRRADAIAKAAAEAVVSCQAAHQLDDPETLAAWAGGPLRAWRADRHYRDSYRADLHDLVDVFCHVQLYLDPRARADVLDRLASGRPATDWPEAADVPDRRVYVERVVAAGHLPYLVDLTTPDLARVGFAAAASVVPGLRCTAPAAFPHLGGAWPQPLSTPESELLPPPLPHA